MSLSLKHTNAISRALRGICNGRVYLKANCDPGDTTIVVGTSGSGFEYDIPGSQLFRNNSLSVVLVEPDGTDVPGAAGIDHSEAITLSEPTGCPNDLATTTGVVDAYTVAAGAYVQLADPPSVCDGLRVIVKDFTEDNVAPESQLPGLWVSWMGTGYGAEHIVAYRQALSFTVRYAMLAADDVDNREVLVDALEQLVNLIAEDNYIGGTVLQSDVVKVIPCWNQQGQNRGQVLDTRGRQVLWGDIVVAAARPAVWDKVST